MDHNNALLLQETPEMAFANSNEAIKIVIGMLSPAVASETASFMVDTSLQLCPEGVRGRPSTPAATSLREHHFAVLMTQVARAYAEGRGQDFADDRSAIDRLLREEPKHRPLAVRFSALMGMWLQDAHNKRQQEKFDRRQKREREEEEEEMKKAQEGQAEDSEDGEESDGEEAVKTRQASEKSPSSTASADSQRVSKDGDEVEGSPAAARTKSVFDLSGLIDTDEDEFSSDDEETSSDEE